MAKNTLWVLLGNGLTIILSFIVTVLVAYYFGAGSDVDALFAALVFPNMIGLIIFSFSLLLLTPSLVRYVREKKHCEANVLINKFFTLSLFFLGGLALIFAIFAVPIMRVYVSGFDERTILLAAQLLRIMACAAPIIGLSGLISAILNAHRHFLLTAFIRPITHCTVITFILIGALFHIGVRGYAFGYLIGAAFAFLMIFIKVHTHYRIRLTLHFSHPEITAYSQLFPPLCAAKMVGYTAVIITQALASMLGVGSIAALYYSLRIVHTPVLLSNSLSTVLYPEVSDLWIRGQIENLSKLLLKTIRMLLFITIPITVFIIFEARDIVEFLFKRGKFTDAASLLTTRTLVIYALAIPSMAVNTIIGDTYWAIRKMKNRLLLEASCVALFIPCALALSKLLSVRGLAAAIVIHVTILSLWGIGYLHTKLIRLESGWLLQMLKEITCYLLTASLIALFVDYSVNHFFSTAIPFVKLVYATLAYFSIFLLLALVFKFKGLMDFKESIARALRRKTQ